VIEDFGAETEAQGAVLAKTGLQPRPSQERQADPQVKEEQGSLDEARLMPGDALQLQPLLEGQTDRYTVRVIGVMRPKSVLVTAPSIDGKLIFVRDGQPFLVRAFSRLNVCAFKAKVLKSQLTPFPYMHLSYPDSVMIMRIRKAIRAPVQLIVAINEGEGGRQLAAGRIVDLSVGGARIQVNSPFAKVGDSVFLSFKIRLDDLEEYIVTQASVRHIEEDTGEAAGAWLLGIQFGELTQPQKLIIMSLVYQHMLKDKD
jgi:c-di-GMP-binding flagellar brake protein YcgR